MEDSIFLFKNKNYKSNNGGFSLVELTVVIFVLSVLSAISIPSILKNIKLTRIDEAKVLMDSYASECLLEYRAGNDLSSVSPPTFSIKKINALGFKKVNGSNCSKFGLAPLNSNDTLLYSFDFRIGEESGTLIKTAVPSTNGSSGNSCELWAGDLCSNDNSLKNSWESIFNLEKQKVKCENDFFNWRNTLPAGSSNRWDDSNQSCTKKTWVYKNYIADSETDYQNIKNNQECTDEKKKYNSYTGEKFIPECQLTFYFFNGIDMGSNNLMQAKKIEEAEAACKVNQENKRLTASNGKQIGETSSGLCGNSYWICNQKILSSLEQWKESSCYSP